MLTFTTVTWTDEMQGVDQNKRRFFRSDRIRCKIQLQLLNGYGSTDCLQ